MDFKQVFPFLMSPNLLIYNIIYRKKKKNLREKCNKNQGYHDKFNPKPIASSASPNVNDMVFQL